MTLHSDFKPTTMRLYLAGPMRGIPEWNFPAFRAAAAALRARGYEVVSPAEMDDAIGGPEVAVQDMRNTLSRDLVEVFKCDGIALLPGWESSPGALLERHAAETVGLRVFTVSGDGNLWRESPWDWVRAASEYVGP